MLLGNAIPTPFYKSKGDSDSDSGKFIIKIDTNNTFGGPNYPFGINTDSLYTLRS